MIRNGVLSFHTYVVHYKNDLIHRENGPAIIYFDSRPSEWWFHGKKIDVRSQEEFAKLIRMSAFW